jgi:hypothetical protein
MMPNASLTLTLPPSVNSAHATNAEGKRVLTAKNGKRRRARISAPSFAALAKGQWHRLYNKRRTLLPASAGEAGAFYSRAGPSPYLPVAAGQNGIPAIPLHASAA